MARRPPAMGAEMTKGRRTSSRAQRQEETKSRSKAMMVIVVEVDTLVSLCSCEAVTLPFSFSFLAITFSICFSHSLSLSMADSPVENFYPHNSGSHYGVDAVASKVQWGVTPRRFAIAISHMV